MSRRLDAEITLTTRTALHASVVACALLVLACSAQDVSEDVSGRDDPAEPRRVVLIVLDTLRADHLGVYGYEKDTAPFIGQLAQRGTVFDRAHSTSSWTAPSTSSIMTGLYPTRHGVIEGFFAHQRRSARDGQDVQPLRRLPADVRLLAERFADAGFRTFGATSNINISDVLGFDRGFERFVHGRNRTAESLFEDVAGWPELRAASHERSFLYLHLNDAHRPYEPREPWSSNALPGEKREVTAYDSEISYIDDQLERLSQRLGWGDDTLVVVVSDHGEEFGDHGGQGHDGGLHEELTRVVMIFSGAGVARGRVASDVSLVDVLPSLIDLAGLDRVVTPDALDGRSLASLLSEPGSRGTADGFSERALLVHRAKMDRRYGGHWWAIVQDGWKLIVDDDERALYDHRTDRRETIDRAAAEPGRTRALAERLDAMRAGGFRSDGERTELTLDDEMVDALTTLGYVEGADEEDAADGEEHPEDE